MATPKQYLKVLHIAILFNVEEKEEKTLMDIASRGTMGVEFDYSSRPISGDALDMFITRNKSSLTAVSLTINGGVSHEKLDTFLPLLLMCQGLKVVSMN